jgi:hypothetical protein
LYLFNYFGLHWGKKIWPKTVSDAEDFVSLEHSREYGV